MYFCVSCFSFMSCVPTPTDYAGRTQHKQEGLLLGVVYVLWIEFLAGGKSSHCSKYAPLIKIRAHTPSSRVECSDHRRNRTVNRASVNRVRPTDPPTAESPPILNLLLTQHREQAVRLIAQPVRYQWDDHQWSELPRSPGENVPTNSAQTSTRKGNLATGEYV